MENLDSATLVALATMIIPSIAILFGINGIGLSILALIDLALRIPAITIFLLII